MKPNKMDAIQQGMVAEADTAMELPNAKKKYLMWMCRTRVIPLEFHDFYIDLPSSCSAPDKLRLTDNIEDEWDNDTKDE